MMDADGCTKPDCPGPQRAERHPRTRRFCAGTAVQDPFYTGPEGHCPDGLCAECWLSHWHEVLVRMAAEKDWREIDKALWLRSQGHTWEQVAEIVGRSARTLRRWRTKRGGS